MLTQHLFLSFVCATLPFVSAIPARRPHRPSNVTSVRPVRGASVNGTVFSGTEIPSATPTPASDPTPTLIPTSTLNSTSTSIPSSGSDSNSTSTPVSTPASIPVPTSASTSASTPASTPNSTLPNSAPSLDTVVAAWYPGWLSSSYPPDKLSWSKYNTMTFSFAVPTADGTLTIDATSEPALPAFVSEAKKNNVRALVSLGGWAGSQHFSTIMATAEGRTKFVKAVLDLASKYNLDGVDFDWEYPGKKGDASNAVSPNDSDNFLQFLQELRKDPAGSKLILSAAVGMTPFIGADSTPKSDVSGFADVFDFIAIMAYDIWGSWSPSVGPNAPLYDSCSPNAVGSGDTAIKAWTAAKFPANKLVLGLPSYGRGYTVQKSEASKIGNYPSFDASAIPAGDQDTSTTASSGNTGIFNFQGLVKQGYLKNDGKAADGVTYKYDDCSQTPYLYKESTQTMISYDDSTSFGTKTRYAKGHGLKGVAIWHGVGDFNDILLDAVQSAISS